jgi:hypothetical protein
VFLDFGVFQKNAHECSLKGILGSVGDYRDLVFQGFLGDKLDG